MVLRLGRRLVACCVGVFALLGFLAVPLGERTGFQHARAIMTGTEARHFYTELFEAARRARQQVWREIGDDARDSKASDEPALSAGAPAATTADVSLDAGVVDASVPYPPGA